MLQLNLKVKEIQVDLEAKQDINKICISKMKISKMEDLRIITNKIT